MTDMPQYNPNEFTQKGQSMISGGVPQQGGTPNAQDIDLQSTDINEITGQGADEPDIINSLIQESRPEQSGYTGNPAGPQQTPQGVPQEGQARPIHIDDNGINRYLPDDDDIIETTIEDSVGGPSTMFDLVKNLAIFGVVLFVLFMPATDEALKPLFPPFLQNANVLLVGKIVLALLVMFGMRLMDMI